MSERLPAELLSLVLDTLPVRIFWKDRESRLLGANQAFATDCGFASPADLIGKSNEESVPSADDAAAYRADDLEVMQSGQAKLGIEESYLHPNGETMWLETNKLPLRDAGGAVLGVLCTYQDITERVRARQERQRLIENLTAARDAARDSLASKNAFIARMSQQLRSPLNVIIGYAELLREEGGLAPNAEKDVDQIIEAGHGLLALVNDMFDTAKISGRVAPHQDVVAPAAIVGEVMAMLEPVAAGNNNVVRWASPPPAFLTVCDAMKLRQCVFNLLSNACKFTQNGAIEVELTTDEEMRTFEIIVTDTGIGIAPAQLERLFTPGEGSGADGAGVGLAITRALAQLMGGDVHAASTFGVGSTFTLRLPKLVPEMKPKLVPQAA